MTHACYLLRSLNPRFRSRFYIGCTVDPRRRLRQHNGEIAQGARLTKHRRPWEMVLCVYGFPSHVVALQFEWAWQHPLKSIAVREAAGALPSLKGVPGMIRLVCTMVTLPEWQSLNLTIQFISSSYLEHRQGSPALPPQMRLFAAPMHALPGKDSDDEGDDLSGCPDTNSQTELWEEENGLRASSLYVGSQACVSEPCLSDAQSPPLELRGTKSSPSGKTGCKEKNRVGSRCTSLSSVRLQTLVSEPCLSDAESPSLELITGTPPCSKKSGKETRRKVRGKNSSSSVRLSAFASDPCLSDAQSPAFESRRKVRGNNHKHSENARPQEEDTDKWCSLALKQSFVSELSESDDCNNLSTPRNFTTTHEIYSATSTVGCRSGTFDVLEDLSFRSNECSVPDTQGDQSGLKSNHRDIKEVSPESQSVDSDSDIEEITLEEFQPVFRRPKVPSIRCPNKSIKDEAKVACSSSLKPSETGPKKENCREVKQDAAGVVQVPVRVLQDTCLTTFWPVRKQAAVIGCLDINAAIGEARKVLKDLSNASDVVNKSGEFGEKFSIGESVLKAGDGKPRCRAASCDEDLQEITVSEFQQSKLSRKARLSGCEGKENTSLY